MVMMVEQGITLQDVTAELTKRHVIDHKVKQERIEIAGGFPRQI